MASSRWTFDVPSICSLGSPPRAQASPRRTPPKVVYRNLRRILRRELDTLAARRFRGTSSAATVSIFLEPVAGIAQDTFCVGELCARNGLMGVINE